MNLIRASLLFASLSVVAACGASGDKSAPAPASAVATPASAVAALSETEVRAVVDAAEAASKNMDVAAAVATLSEDVRFTFVQPASPAQSIGREQIIADMGKTATDSRDRTYTSQVGGVRMAADGASAAVDVQVSEQMTVQGHKVETTSDQTYTVARRQGQAKIVAMTSKLTGLVMDGEKRL